jgi:hypothetical protein
MLQILRDMVGETGSVGEVYGGYEITVKNKEKFPWYETCNFLLDSSFEVWMVKSETSLVVMSKPAVD